MKAFLVAHNVLQIGDFALCCSDDSGRKGNIAYTLLWA
jgi:hypothetical protein